MKVHGPKSFWYDKVPASFSSKPSAACYDDKPNEKRGKETRETGFPRQLDYNKAVGACLQLLCFAAPSYESDIATVAAMADEVRDSFFRIWEKMTAEQGFLDLRSRLNPSKEPGDPAPAEGAAVPAGKVFKSGGAIYTLKEGKGFDGLWSRSPFPAYSTVCPHKNCEAAVVRLNT